MAKSESRAGQKTFYAKNRKEWRNWLKKNHEKEKAVWLILYNKGSEVSSVQMGEAVEEALCFGWIDSKANKRDEHSRYQFFSRRNPRSNWSAINKQRVKRLTEEGQMTESGLKMVRLARRTGTWTVMNAVEKEVLAGDLQEAFRKSPAALEHFKSFPRSVRKGILAWIYSAKRENTRSERIKKTVSLAAKNLRAR